MSSLHPFFHDIIGHAAACRVLSHAVSRPAPGYVFFGPEGVGKRLIAERFARVLLDVSLEASLDAHPDVMRAEREEGKKEFSVEMARALIERVALTSAAGGYKVALIDEAERWNTEACNAVLKQVEEARERTVFLFVTEDAERLPATLRSRLVPLAFEPLSSADMQAFAERVRVSASETARALTIAHGSPGRLTRYMERREDYLGLYAEAEALLNVLATQKEGVQCAELETFARRREQSDDAVFAWREALIILGRLWSGLAERDPAAAVRVGKGLVQAHRLIGTSLSPRLGLEWSAVSPYLIEQERPIARFLSL